MIYEFSKRTFDLTFACVAICLLAPLMLIIAIMVKCESKGASIYKARRTGQYGVTFRMLKFRTMVFNAENLGGASTALHDPRLTRIGRMLRKYKFDELPQFFNIVKGEMSLVGPRPQVEKYTDLYEGDLLQILDVKPGLTDFASVYFADMDLVLGDDNPDEYYERKIEPVKNELRLRYVRQRSFTTDLYLIWATGLQVLRIKKISKLDGIL